ncbi:MAG: ATP-binding cassette domain-containing protein [Corynebacterium sp.]|nr:ATP-binding cassette domain-containing protein [Corynebacterium sp.]
MGHLKICSISKSYGAKQVLDAIDFQVDSGEIYGFVGSNGAGKSTTMRIAMGLLEQDSGTVEINGEPITPASRRTIGYMPEERGLYAKDHVSRQLIFFAQMHGLSALQAKSNAEALMERLEISQYANQNLETLSLGNQQRVQLAASLVHDPNLLILDEPFSGLDPVAVATMSSLLEEQAQKGVAILFSSHQLDLVQRISDRIGIISSGRLEVQGSVQELRSQGKTRYLVETAQRDWYPAGITVFQENESTVIVEAPDESYSQKILQAALEAGPVETFQRYLPDLSELFHEVVRA